MHHLDSGCGQSHLLAAGGHIVHLNTRLRFIIYLLFIGPESDHWQCLSLTDSLTHSCLVNLIDVTLVCEDANSKLVEVVTIAAVDA